MTDTTVTNNKRGTPRPFGEELMDMVFDGRRRAQVRTRLMRRLDQQRAALMRATDSDIGRVERDTRGLIELTDLLLAVGTLGSFRDPSQLRKVKERLADLKSELARRLSRSGAINNDG